MRKLFVFAFAVALGLPVLGLVASQPASVALACSGPNINIANPPSGATLSNSIIIESVTSAVVAGVEYSVRPLPINTTVNPIILGQATSEPSDPLRWRLSWATNGLPNGQYYLYARAIYPTGSTVADCLSNPTNISVANGAPTTAPVLTVSIQPASWEGPTNVSVSFKATVAYKDSAGQITDVSTASVFGWSTTIGSIGTGGHTVGYYSGPQDGTGQLNLSAHYNNLTATASAALKINPSSSYTTPSPTPNSDTGPSPSVAPAPGATTAGGPSPSPTPHPTTPPISVQPDSKEAGCLEKILGTTRFKDINSGASQPTAEERQKGAVCFGNGSLVPSPLAPVAPADVKNLPTDSTNKITVGEAKQESKQDSAGKEQKIIKLSGKAAPNTEVYLYIFSEPLVLKTKADGDGNWNYTLENPLKPGKHEVYATTEKEPASFVRSQPLFINVARALASEQNPQGNSLNLAQASRLEFILYLGGGILLILVGIRLLLLVHKRFKKKPLDSEVTPIPPTV